MKEITIYEFQLKTIIEALRITSNIHNSSKGKTCHDRQVRQALEFAKTLRDDQVIDFLTDNADPEIEQAFARWLEAV